MAFNRVIFLAILAVTAVELIGEAAAATYVVGDSMGWTVPSGGAAAYATYASQHVFTVGDVLVFNFPTGAHDVAQVTKDAYDGCSSTNPTILATLGPTNITLVSAGGAYFICTFGQHCPLGQKLAINVVANSTTTTPPPSSTMPPGGTTTPPPTSTPAPGSTATPPSPASTPAHSPPTASPPAHSPGGMATPPALSPGGTATSPAPSPGGTTTSPAPSPGGAATAPSPSPGGASTSPPPGSSPSPSEGDVGPPPPGNAAAVTSIGFSVVVMIVSVAFGLMI